LLLRQGFEIEGSREQMWLVTFVFWWSGSVVYIGVVS
jgi:hypothetical protein